MIGKHIIVILFALHSIVGQPVEVETTSGRVAGHTKTVLGKTVNEFIGIPFAEPPIGDFRFAKPRPITTPLPGVIDATKDKHSCMQPLPPNYIFSGPVSEDCLYLNVWSTPNTTKEATLKPVMFWIYGGAYKFGSIFTPLYNGGVLATKDVVIVTANYRLGPFGFLYDGTDKAPGNMALYDQILALKWVQDNIAKFGGDKNQVTIFGESAGSWSVSAHVMSPLSKGLFKRAIMESGSVYLFKDKYPITKEVALKEAKKFAESQLCFGHDFVDCLKKRPAALMNLDLEDTLTNFMFPPMIGSDFLPENIYQAFVDGKFNHDLDIIAGCNKDEGSYLAEVVDPLFLIKLGYTEIDLKLFMEGANRVAHYPFSESDLNKALSFYMKGVGLLDFGKIKTQAKNFLSDVLMKCPTYLHAKRYAQFANSTKNNVYFYELDYGPEFAVKILGNTINKLIGVFHAADVISVWGVPFSGLLEVAFDEHDRQMSQDMMTYWTNFAKTGNPGNWKPLLINGKGVHDESVKILKPGTKEYSENLFDSNCDGFWSKYFG